MTTSTTRADAGPPETGESTTLSHRQVLTILSGLLLGMFLAALDQNIVSVAIVNIANSLHGFDEQAWATTAYLITATITTPLYGKLADIYGRKPFYLIAIGLFVIGSVACTFATSMYQLAAFRAFQGLGAGGLMSLAFTIIGDIVPARERVRYQGYFMIVFGGATVLGPVLGGFFSDYEILGGIEGWRWVFLVNVPVGVLAMIVVAKVLNVPHQRQNHRIDWPGALALAVFVVPLLVVAEQGRHWGWDSTKALTCYGIGAAGLLLFVVIEFLMKDAALIPLRLFKNSTFSVTIAGGFIVGVAMFGAITMVPQYFQVVRGYSPTKAGLLMLPLVLGIMIGSGVAGQITKRTGRYKILPVAGTFIIAVGAVLYAQVHYDSALWQPLVYGGVIGLGLGCCMQTLIIAAQNAGPRSDMGVSTASATFFRQMGGTLGVAIFLTILFNLLPRKITDAFGGQLPPGFDSAALGDLQSNTSGIAALPPELRVPILTGFTDSMQGVFYAAAAVALLACVVLMFMKEIPLQDAPVPAAQPEPAEHAAAAEADTAPSWDEDQVWEGAAQALSEPEPVLAAAAARHAKANGHAGLDSTATAAVDSGNGYSDDVSITGRVHREDGHPVPDAALTLIDPRGRQAARATGDGHGEFAFGAADAGSYVLIASASGHQPTAVNVTVGSQPQRLDLTLHGSGRLSGVVRSAGSGDPLAGATVTLTDQRGEVVAAALSGEDGTYVCEGVVAGSYTLVAVADHMRPDAITLSVPDTGVLRHDVELTPMAVLVGTAATEDGRTIADAQITVLDDTGELTATARTDEHGRYVVPDLPVGRYTIVARGYPAVTGQVLVSGGEVSHDVQLGYDSED
ncbi:MFS transporter [Nocardia cyriacigeorgica]|uniref:alpha-amylase n=1 Tax=Nocardia cyriacigeorgica TaxID=135487 RepID=A0A6P1D7E5_9NOCA|nr:MFS transporter [Nocardia cyriacigeorgica]NEW39782.1 MFS transporter [Nocardia cyriacigeorgica]NEW45509.1 MFS transporter [Nocardia cyriacigeorgica]NEW52416.1 MFS transporter [Nocardia cyriacigeorgica]